MFNLLDKVQLHQSKHMSTLMLIGKILSKHDRSELVDATQYRTMISALQYFTLTRLEISIFTNKFCQFLHNPTSAYWIGVKRLLRYLNRAIDHGLMLYRY